MKKVKSRTAAVLLLAAFIVAGLSFFVVRLALNGRSWAAFPANGDVYSGGVLKNGAVYDRSGLLLAGVRDGARVYAENELTRRATLHAVGDAQGNIGTGALKIFSADLAGYDFVNGTYTFGGTGGRVNLSIDASLNEAAYTALDGRSGTVAVCNYETGEVVCMVSTPSYDPENPPELSEDDTSGVYLNRFLSASYTPGSVFKLVTLAAAIENIDDLWSRTFTCTGSCDVGGDTVTCSGTHGEIDIYQALAHSCNVAFAELALELGGDTLASYAQVMGLTEGFDLSGVTTASGSFDSAADGSSTLAWSGIGQSTDLVNPAAMLRLMCAIAGDGTAPELTLKAGEGGGLLHAGKRLLRADTAEKLREMMNYDVVYNYGADNYPGLELCAKSGTAEVGGGASPHAWFVGFITNTDAPLAFVVVVENGGYGSSTGGAIANTVLQEAVNP